MCTCDAEEKLVEYITGVSRVKSKMAVAGDLNVVIVAPNFVASGTKVGL